MLTRPQFLSSAAATALLLAPLARARADEPVVRIGALTIDTTAEVWYAQDLGYFKKEGLNVEITPFPNGAAASAALAGGAVDISITDAVSMASAHAHGIPISYVAPAGVHTVTQPAYAVIVPVNSPIVTAKDFAGKTIAVNGIKNILQIPLEAWIENNGGNPRAVRFIELPFPSMVPAIESGQIDGASVSEPFITSAVSTGKFRAISQTVKGLAPRFAFSGWSVSNDWAARHPDQVKKFVAVMYETARWANVSHPESAQILVRVSKMPPDLANKLIRAYYGEHLDASLFQPVIDATAKYGVIPKPFPAVEIFNPAALH
jgi:NitT/TauT family transport system substrate-binding protein